MKNYTTEQLKETLRNLYTSYKITKIQSASESTWMCQIAEELLSRGVSFNEIMSLRGE